METYTYILKRKSDYKLHSQNITTKTQVHETHAETTWSFRSCDIQDSARNCPQGATCACDLRAGNAHLSYEITISRCPGDAPSPAGGGGGSRGETPVPWGSPGRSLRVLVQLAARFLSSHLCFLPEMATIPFRIL